MKRIVLFPTFAALIVLTGCASQSIERRFTSYPSYAKIFCDGEYAGTTPATLYEPLDWNKIEGDTLKLIPCSIKWVTGEEVVFKDFMEIDLTTKANVILGGSVGVSSHADHPDNKKLKKAIAHTEKIYSQKIKEQAIIQRAQRERADQRRALTQAQTQSSGGFAEGMAQMLGQLNQIQQQNAAHARQMIDLYRSAPTYSVTPMAPIGPAAVDVYSVQRINDNLYGVRQVR